MNQRFGLARVDRHDVRHAGVGGSEKKRENFGVCTDDCNVQFLIERVLEGVQSQCYAEERGRKMGGECQLRWCGEERVLRGSEELQEEGLDGCFRSRALRHREVITNRLPREEGLLQLARQGGVGKDELGKDINHLRVMNK